MSSGKRWPFCLSFNVLMAFFVYFIWKKYVSISFVILIFTVNKIMLKHQSNVKDSIYIVYNISVTLFQTVPIFFHN